MYGFSPAAFQPRSEDDIEQYESLEMEWLLAFWDYYVDRVTDTDKVFDLTKLGISTGTLMMSDETADSYRRGDFVIVKKVVRAKTRKLSAAWTVQMASQAHQSSLTALDEIADQVRLEIDRGIRGMLEQTAFQRSEADLMRALSLAPRGANPVLTRESLRAQEVLLEAFPLRTARGERMRTMGIKV
jgi:hypothetical protein